MSSTSRSTVVAADAKFEGAGDSRPERRIPSLGPHPEIVATDKVRTDNRKYLKADDPESNKHVLVIIVLIVVHIIV